MQKKIVQFFFGIFLIWLFITQLAPLCSNIEAYQQIRKTIQYNNIETDALFYTESPNAAKAEFYLKKPK